MFSVPPVLSLSGAQCSSWNKSVCVCGGVYGTRIIHRKTHTHTPGALGTSGWRTCLFCAVCVCVSQCPRDTRFNYGIIMMRWIGGEAGGGSEGAREDLEEGETRDKAEDDNERRWGFKGEKYFIGLLTNHAQHQLALTRQSRSVPASANSATLTKDPSVCPFTEPPLGCAPRAASLISSAEGRGWSGRLITRRLLST